jgi:hypothetical protein
LTRHWLQCCCCCRRHDGFFVDVPLLVYLLDYEEEIFVDEQSLDAEGDGQSKAM